MYNGLMTSMTLKVTVNVPIFNRNEMNSLTLLLYLGKLNHASIINILGKYAET